MLCVPWRREPDVGGSVVDAQAEDVVACGANGGSLSPRRRWKRWILTRFAATKREMRRIRRVNCDVPAYVLGAVTAE